MPATISTTRLSRVALLAVTGATALSLAACGGTSNTAKPTSASPTNPAPSSSAPSASGPSAKGKDWVNGLIDSVSGNTIQVSQRSGSATVDFSPSTAVSEITPAQLTDITTGSCISVRPDRHGGSTDASAVTARSVRVSTAVDGKCPQPNQGSNTPAAHHQLSGQVASVAGNTITLNSADAGGNSPQTSVTVTDTTKYSKQSSSDAQAIAQGKCIAAHGSTDGGGALQATSISIQPSDNGSCPQLGGGKHHRH
jgi:hypothetical protein